MITVLFGFASDKILITIRGNDIRFASTAFGAQEASIEGIKLDYAGVIREHPDLEVSEDWKEIAIERFKAKIKSYHSEEETAQYVIDELKKFGYIPEQKQREGFRPEKLK